MQPMENNRTEIQRFRSTVMVLFTPHVNGKSSICPTVLRCMAAVTFAGSGIRQPSRRMWTRRNCTLRLDSFECNKMEVKGIYQTEAAKRAKD